MSNSFSRQFLNHLEEINRKATYMRKLLSERYSYLGFSMAQKLQLTRKTIWAKVKRE